jgi:hypothetical protein
MRLDPSTIAAVSESAAVSMDTIRDVYGKLERSRAAQLQAREAVFPPDPDGSPE